MFSSVGPGQRSGALAQVLRDWLPMVINAIKPWLSVDMHKGTRWSADVAAKLQDCRCGLICLTPDNLHADWILFEAGALSKTLSSTYVCPVLLDLKPSDVPPGPLSQFQMTELNRDDMMRLLQTINSALGTDALGHPHLESAFEVWWPKFQERLSGVAAHRELQRHKRSDRDLLEEILGLVRQNLQVSESRSPRSPTQKRESPILEIVKDLVQAELTAKGFAVSSIAYGSAEEDDSQMRIIVGTVTGHPFFITIRVNEPISIIHRDIHQQIAKIADSVVQPTLMQPERRSS